MSSLALMSFSSSRRGAWKSPSFRISRGGQLIPDGRIIWLWGARSGPSLCGGPWPSGAIIFLGGAAMELACIRAMLERTASQPSSPAHFIWSRTELLGRCDIAVVYVSAGTGVGTRSSRDPSVRMVGLVGSHTHLTHLALKLLSFTRPTFPRPSSLQTQETPQDVTHSPTQQQSLLKRREKGHLLLPAPR